MAWDFPDLVLLAVVDSFRLILTVVRLTIIGMAFKTLVLHETIHKPNINKNTLTCSEQSKGKQTNNEMIIVTVMHSKKASFYNNNTIIYRRAVWEHHDTSLCPALEPSYADPTFTYQSHIYGYLLHSFVL